MSPRLSRLRVAEWWIAVASVALIVILFASPWYTLRSAHGVASTPAAQDGWESLNILGPLTLIVGVLGIAVWCLQATQAAPAVPACASVVLGLFSFVALIGLVVRVGIAPPRAADRDVLWGAWTAAALTVGIFLGAYWSLRTEGIPAADGPQSIPVIDVDELIRTGSPAPEP